jgi:hypothetical protein
MNIEDVKKMSNEEIRIAVAEFCGYHGCHWEGPRDCQVFMPTHRDGVPRGYWQGTVPDFPNDLNAMYEAEEILDGNERNNKCSLSTLYKGILASICCDPCPIHASARLRAEAFILVMNKKA